MSRTSDVSVLPGVGKKTKFALNSVNIHTIDDLISYKQAVPGVDIAALHRVSKTFLNEDDKLTPQTNVPIIIEKTSNGWKTNAHTWYNCVCHIPRRGKLVSRAVIRDLVVSPYAIELTVHFFSNKRLTMKRVHPITIYTMQTLWLSREITSEDDDENSENTTVGAFERVLPVFGLTDLTLKDRVPAESLSAISRVITECKYTQEIVSDQVITA